MPASEDTTKPYFIRAIYEWCVDNGQVPYLTFFANQRTGVPAEHIRDDFVTLNIGPEAVQHLVLGNETIQFQARFGSVAKEITLLVEAVLAIYARDTNIGLEFSVQADLYDEKTPDASLSKIPTTEQVNVKKSAARAKNLIAAVPPQEEEVRASSTTKKFSASAAKKLEQKQAATKISEKRGNHLSLVKK